MPKVDIPVETLIEQLHSAEWVARCDAARLLGQSRDPRAVEQATQDPDEIVHKAATWAFHALQKLLLYRKQSGL